MKHRELVEICLLSFFEEGFGAIFTVLVWIFLVVRDKLFRLIKYLRGTWR